MEEREQPSANMNRSLPGQTPESKAKVLVLASDKVWVDGEAVRQLQRTAELPGMRLAVGLPDLHPGRGSPIGAAFMTEGVFYPHLVGNDVGCGMGLWRTDLRKKKMKLERFVKKLSDLERSWSGDIPVWLAEQGIELRTHHEGLGTIGGGNHFAELQIVEAVQDDSYFEKLGFSREDLVLLVHSGSRGLGEALLSSHLEDHGAQGLTEGTEAASRYLERHDEILRWAQANRAFIAHRFLSALGATGEPVLDHSHNSVRKATFRGVDSWLHRKNTTPSEEGPMAIPGSRGSLTYLVAPCGDQANNLFSVVHGAGRRWNRSDAKKRLHRRYSPEALTRTEFGGRVICEDRDLLYEEAPQAYKKIEVVIQDLIDAGLIRIIATLSPIITYKMRKIRD